MKNLYQLKTIAQPGDYVTIDGPTDRYGQVMKHQDSEYHLIRGLGTERPQASVIYRTEID